MNKQDALKLQKNLQPCVLRVNIQCDCEGCHQKVKKTLQKIDGVHKVSVDVEQGKVTVLGNVDPANLIKKLEKAGKHAELWGGQKGQFPNLSDQFKNMLMENAIGGKEGKSQKEGKAQFLAPQQMNQNNNNKGVKFDKKNYKPLLPEDDEEDDEFDEDVDDDDDDFDDEESEDSFDDHHHHKPAIKLPTVPRGGGGHGPKGNNVTLNALVKDNNGANNGGKGKKGGGFDLMFLKGMLGKAGGKKDKEGKKSKPGNQGKGGGKKDGHLEKDESKKNGDKEGKNNPHKNSGGGKDDTTWSKKGGKNFDGVPKMDNVQFNEAMMNQNHKGNGPFPMGQKGSFPMGQMGNFHGLPAMNAGNQFQGFGQGHPPYEQQPYGVPWMMNQQPGYGQNMYHSMMHMRPHPAPGYGVPPPGSDRYTHMFDDENPNSCSIM